MSLQLRQGTNAERLTVTPLSGEPIWTTDTKALYIGDGTTAGGVLITGGQYTLPTASTSTLGGVKVGANLSIDQNGVLSATAVPLSAATTSTLGGVRVGAGLAIDGNGVLSASGGSSMGNFVFSGTQVATTVSMVLLADTGNTIFSNPFGSVIVGTSGNAITVNGNAGAIIMPDGGRIEGVSGNYFALAGVSGITFQDGTTLSSSGVGVATSTLTNGTKVVELSSTGTLSLAGHVVLPQRDLQADYDVTATSVSGVEVVIEGGDYPYPQAGWLYNGYTIASVVGLSGNYQLNFDVSLPFSTGTYVLRAFPNQLPFEIKFSDGTVQTTAYTGQTGGTGTVNLSSVAQSIVPSANITYDLGTPSKQWRSLYVSSSTIYIGGKALSVNETGQVTVDGTPAIGSTATNYDDVTWNPPVGNPWKIVTYTGGFAGTYTQDVTSNTLSTTASTTGTGLTEVSISRLSYPNIDNVLPAYNQITVDGLDITSWVAQIRLDRYPNDATIILTTGSSVDVYDSSSIEIRYTTTGSGAITWFDFSQTPSNGTGLLSGQIEYQATVEMNDGNGVKVGKSGTLTFNIPSEQFDQTGFVFGPTTGTNACVFTEFDPTTGFKYKTNLGLGELDKLKIQWKATLFYNGTWF